MPVLHPQALRGAWGARADCTPPCAPLGWGRPQGSRRSGSCFYCQKLASPGGGAAEDGTLLPLPCHPGLGRCPSVLPQHRADLGFLGGQGHALRARCPDLSCCCWCPTTLGRGLAALPGPGESGPASGTQHTSCPLGLRSPAPPVLCCRRAEPLCLTSGPTNPCNTRDKLCQWLWSAVCPYCRVSPWGVLSPGGRWARSRDIVVVSLEGYYWPPASRRRDTTQSPKTYRWPTQRSVPPEVGARVGLCPPRPLSQVGQGRWSPGSGQQPWAWQPGQGYLRPPGTAPGLTAEAGPPGSLHSEPVPWGPELLESWPPGARGSCTART